MRHLAIALSLVAATAYAGPEKIAIADHDGAKVVMIDASDGKALGSVSLGTDNPDRVLATPDGSRLVAISRGPGTISWALRNFRPTGHGTASIIDAATMTVVKRIELGWDAADAQITDDGRTLVVLSPGIETKGRDTKYGSLYTIDLRSGNVTGKIEFDRLAATSFLLNDQTHAAVYFEANETTGERNAFRFVDLGTMKPAGDSIGISGALQRPVAVAGQPFIYVLDRAGSEAPKMYVISTAERKLAGSYSVPGDPHIAAFDDATGRLFVLGRGQLAVFRNAAPEKTVNVGRFPLSLGFTPDRRSIVVTGMPAMVVSLDTLQVKGELSRATGSEVYVSPDGRRAFFYSSSAVTGTDASRVVVEDLAAMKELKRYNVGSNGSRLARVVLAGATAGLVHVAINPHSSTVPFYLPLGVSGGTGLMAIRSDGKFAYALDPNTSCVSVIDVETGERLQCIPSGDNAIVTLKDNALLAVPGTRKLTFIDTAKNDRAGEPILFDGDLRGAETNADRSRLIVFYDGKVAVYDDHGKRLGEQAVKSPVSWVFVK